jgi:fructose-1,6-bisphosphatase
MEDVIIKGDELQQIILKSIPEVLKEKFKSSYSNPLADAITEVLKEKDGVIKEFIRDIISEMLNSEELKKNFARIGVKRLALMSAYDAAAKQIKRLEETNAPNKNEKILEITKALNKKYVEASR